MDNYDVVWSRESVYDIADIADYIELRFGIDRADKFIEEIDNSGKALGTDFKYYTRTGIYYRNYLILKKIVKPSIIFYFVDEDTHKVFIIRILRHERNWQKMLKDGFSYTFD